MSPTSSFGKFAKHLNSAGNRYFHKAKGSPKERKFTAKSLGEAERGLNQLEYWQIEKYAHSLANMPTGALLMFSRLKSDREASEVGSALVTQQVATLSSILSGISAATQFDETELKRWRDCYAATSRES